METLHPQARKCLYSHEAKEVEGTKIFGKIKEHFKKYSRPFALNRTMFANYSQSGCIYQCKMVGAILVSHSSTFVDCIPWDHPPGANGKGIYIFEILKPMMIIIMHILHKLKVRSVMPTCTRSFWKERTKFTVNSVKNFPIAPQHSIQSR